MAGEPDLTVWYFAYASNLLREKRTARAGLQALEETPGVLRDWKLSFELPAFGWIEPAMASIRPAPGDSVHGLLLRLKAEQLEALDRSEGSMRIYVHTPVEVEAYDGRRIEAVTYTTRPGSGVEEPLLPSERYLGIIRQGCRESGIDEAYCARLEAHPVAPSTRFTRWLSRRVMDALMIAAPLGLHRPVFGYIVFAQRVDARLGWLASMPMLLPVGAVGAIVRIFRR